ncbi:MAG TPA: YbhB/YbcL family Raf kinase inhibitor-like protein [Sphingomicrobium sp.]|nr:YbhB/YbcL family Raf kinase inhibitor-like protein [Sphingomicrobium sp.]
MNSPVLIFAGKRWPTRAVEAVSVQRRLPMLPRSLLMILFTALASCGARDDSANPVKEGSVVEKMTHAKLSLRSDAFREGEPIPAQYTCDGANNIPVLHWGAPPPEARSFALVVDDPDAPGGTFRHWGVYDIPSSARSIGQGLRLGSEVRNDFGSPGYGGPCPPKGHGPHHYHFKLFALSVDRLDIPGSAKIADVEHAAEQHAVAQGELVGTFERK